MMHDRARATCLLCLLIVTLVLPATASGQSPSRAALPRQTDNFTPTKQWFTLAPAVDEFSVEMPGFSGNIPSTPTDDTRSYIYYEDDAKNYMVRVFPVPAHQRNISNGELLRKYGDIKPLNQSSSQSSPPKIINLTVKDAPGLEYRWSDAKEIRVRRIYVRKQIFYTLQGHAPLSEAAAVERFLNSFTFEEPKGDDLSSAPVEVSWFS